MFSFKVINSIKDVPKQWIYKHYLDITQPMDGRTIRTRSFINRDTTPSLFIYIKDGVYRWKDFSSGYSGSAIDMIMIMNPGITFAEACIKIVNDYNLYIHKKGPFVPDRIETSISDYSLKAEYESRAWNDKDIKFWTTNLGIELPLLEHYFVTPLKWYQLSKVYTIHKKTYNLVQHERMYGYFTKEGELYAIYQPDYRDLKFIKLFPYIHGIDQLTKTCDTLLICASLKDQLIPESLKINVETIAPMSETTLLSVSEIDMFKAEYKYIFTLFDNDRAGIQSMKRYKEIYGIDFVYFPLEKDLADARQYLGADKVRSELIIRINKKIELCNLQHTGHSVKALTTTTDLKPTTGITLNF